MNTKLFGILCVFIGSLFCCFNLLADPLNNWHWRNPLPNGNPQFPAAQVLNGIIFTNGTFFAVGNSGVVATSLNGTNWAQNSTATSNELNGIIFARCEIYGRGQRGDDRDFSDGTNWGLRSSGTTGNLNSVAYGNGKFAVVGDVVLASSDPRIGHWRFGLSGATAVAANGMGFVALDGSSRDYFSTDGLNWTANPFTVPVSGFDGFGLDAQIVTATDNGFVIGSHIM